MRTQPAPCLWLIAVLPFWIAPSLAAQTYMTEGSHVEFTSSVPLHTFTGESENLVGMVNLADSTVDFYVDLTTLETGLGKRDKDMRITLETDKFPFAEFFGKLVSPFDPENPEPQPAIARGDFKIHGVSRSIEVEGTLQKTDTGLALKAAWDLQLEDYEIVPPKLLFIKVDQTQALKIDALLTPTEN